MKQITRFILVCSAAICAMAGCTKSEKERVEAIYGFFAADTTVADSYRKINRVCPDRPAGSQGAADIIDYFTMMASRSGADDDISFLDAPGGKGRGILMEIPGKNRNSIILVTAASDTWSDSLSVHNGDAACIAAYEVLNAFKRLRIKPYNTVRILIYPDCSGTHAGFRPYASRLSGNPEENHVVQINLTSDPDAPMKTFTIGEPTDIFRTFMKVIPPFFEGHGEYTFQRGEYTPEGWGLRIPFYHYNIDRNDMSKDIAAVVSLVALLS